MNKYFFTLLRERYNLAKKGRVDKYGGDEIFIDFLRCWEKKAKFKVSMKSEAKTSFEEEDPRLSQNSRIRGFGKTFLSKVGIRIIYKERKGLL